VLDEILRALAEDERREVGWTSRSASWTAPSLGRKRGRVGGKDPRQGKGMKLMALANSSGLPLAICAASASPHEVTRVEASREASFVCEELRLLGTTAFDRRPDLRLRSPGRSPKGAKLRDDRATP
jgi:hypothetical protein